MDNQFLLRPLVFAILVVIFTGSSSAFANEELTPEQIILLMKASREQYVTIEAKMKAVRYENVGKDAKPELQSTREIISRWTKNKSFSKTTETQHLDIIPYEGYTPITIKTYAITSEWSKRLLEVPDGRIPRGNVEPGRALERQKPFYNIYI